MVSWTDTLSSSGLLTKSGGESRQICVAGAVGRERTFNLTSFPVSAENRQMTFLCVREKKAAAGNRCGHGSRRFGRAGSAAV